MAKKNTLLASANQADGLKQIQIEKDRHLDDIAPKRKLATWIDSTIVIDEPKESTKLPGSVMAELKSALLHEKKPIIHAISEAVLEYLEKHYNVDISPFKA